VKFSLIRIFAVTIVDEYSVDRVYALEVDIDLRKGCDPCVSHPVVHCLGSQVEGVERNV